MFLIWSLFMGWANALGMVAWGVVMLLAAAVLTPSDYGVGGFSFFACGIAFALSDAGLTAAIATHPPVGASRHRVMLYALAVCGLMSLLLWAAAPLIARVTSKPALEQLLRVGALTPVLSMAGRIRVAFGQAAMKFGRIAIAETISTLIAATLVVVALFLVRHPVVLPLGLLLRGGITSATSLLLIKSEHNFAAGSKEFSFYLKFSGAQIVERLSNYLGANIDYFIVGTFMSQRALGLYTFSYEVVSLPCRLINTPLNRIALPAYAKLRDKALQLFYQKISTATTLPSAVLLAPLVVLSPSLLSLFGDKWSSATLFIKMLIPVGIIRAFLNPIGSLVLGRGRPVLTMRWNIAYVLTQTAILIWCTRFSLEAVCMGVTFAAVLYVPMLYLYLYRPVTGGTLQCYLTPLGWGVTGAASAIGTSILLLKLIGFWATALGVVAVSVLLLLFLVNRIDKVIGSKKTVVQKE